MVNNKFIRPLRLSGKNYFCTLIFKIPMAETKEDQGINIEETLGRTEEFVNKNKKSLMIIGGAVAIAVAGYLYYQYSYVAGKEKETEAQMFRAEEYFRTDSL